MIKYKIEFDLDTDKYLLLFGSKFNLDEFSSWIKERLKNNLYINNVDVKCIDNTL